VRLVGWRLDVEDGGVSALRRGEILHSSAPSGRAFSLTGLSAGVCIAALLVQALVAWILVRFAALPPAAALPLALLVVLPFAVWAASRTLRPLRATLAMLADGVRNFRDGDFGVRLAAGRRDELGDLVRMYNQVAATLQEERGAVRQRELLLRTALDRSPTAIVLVNAIDRVIYANDEARLLFLAGARLEGHALADLLERSPDEMRRLFASGADGIFSVDGASSGERETYHLARREFTLNRSRHTLLLVRRLTAELGRQEATIWKKVIRIVAHELNNSLAPISSLAHSARTLSDTAPERARLEPIFSAIRERIDSLGVFLEGYARFARLPEPHPREHDWGRFLDGLDRIWDFRVDRPLPTEPGWFDAAQLEQVVINLLKNAVEASDGEPQVVVRVERAPDGSTLLRVLDRGRGMDEALMRRALLPFYSTKPQGAGIGLPLCREIVEAHGGKLAIQSRHGGGTVVTCWLPPRPID
jgi:nitrogen fixation/metabolism regulation signal transduction histidine kinase